MYKLNRYIKSTSLLLLLLLLSCERSDEIRLAAVFSNNMVLQQNADIIIWGWAAPGTRISLKTDWEEKFSYAKADKDGRFEIEVSTPSAGGPYTVTISSLNEIVIENVMIGEVWLCSGQSNMEMPMRGYSDNDTIFGAKSDILTSKNDNIRLFHVDRNLTFSPTESLKGNWKIASPDAVSWFSAVGYYFAKELQDSLQVPIGIISCSYGGSPIESWLPNEVIASDSIYQDYATERQREEDASLKSREDIKGEISEWLRSSRTTSNIHETPCKLSLPEDMRQHASHTYLGELVFEKVIRIQEHLLGDTFVLSLGEINDIGQVYLNDSLIWEELFPSKSYSHCKLKLGPEIFLEGDNTLKVYVENILWGGGLNGPEEDMYIQFLGSVEETISIAGSWKMKKSFALSEVPAMPVEGYPHFQMASSLYNGMLSQLIPYRMQGVIWYQGEANVWTAQNYQHSFADLVSSWRDKWSFPLAFHYVQIAPFNYNSGLVQKAPILREAQRVSQEIEGVSMSVTLDLGVNSNIHPPFKKEVGHRLALGAFHDQYAYENIYSGPVYSQFCIENDVIRLSFLASESKLILKGTAISGFEMCGADGIFYRAEAWIDGEDILLKSSHVEKPKHARYAWSDTAFATLFNEAGLPSSSFSTRSELK